MSRLTLNDVSNPMFDRRRFVKRKLPDEGWAFEGVTVTDNFFEVGVTYFLETGRLTVVDTSNKLLFDDKVETPEEFAKAMKKVDTKLRRRKRP